MHAPPGHVPMHWVHDAYELQGGAGATPMGSVAIRRAGGVGRPDIVAMPLYRKRFQVLYTTLPRDFAAHYSQGLNGMRYNPSN